MKIFEKLYIKTQNRYLHTYYKICGISFFKICYDKVSNLSQYSFFPNLTKKHFTPKDIRQPVFYLKINMDTGFAEICLQNWIKIVEKLNAEYYIICDKPEVKKKMLQSLVFQDENIKFIKSCRNTYLAKIVKNIATHIWINAAFAHLTTFYHAKQNNVQEFWNIDADDTIFLIDVEKTITLLENARAYARKNNLDCFSFDMWHSRTNKKHWSFGITYTNNTRDWFKLFEENQNSLWQEEYKAITSLYNIDWFFTYLKDKKNIKNETFYANNLQFIHWGNFVANPILASISHFLNGKVLYPIGLYILKDDELGQINIADSCIKIDIEIANQEATAMYFNSILTLRFLQPEFIKLYGIEHAYKKIDPSALPKIW